MSRRILIVPDKFKGTLTAQQAAAAIATGWHDARPDDILEEMPMADGGDGFGKILGQVLNAQPQHCTTVDAAGHRRVAEWWLAAHSHVALVETAQVIGLALLTANKYHPFHLDTFLDLAGEPDGLVSDAINPRTPLVGAAYGLPRARKYPAVNSVRKRPVSVVLVEPLQHRSRHREYLSHGGAARR